MRLSNVGREIQRLQDLAGLSDAALADELGVRENTVYRWKRGIHKIKWIYLRRLQELANQGGNQDGTGTSSTERTSSSFPG